MMEINEASLPSDDVHDPLSKTRGLAFWLVLVANLSCDFLSAFDLSALSTALPTIVSDLNGTNYIWAATAYALAGTAATPLVGGLATAFGRKPILLLSLAFFTVGAAICGAAQNMNMLIAGRVIQGFGGGLCESSVEVVYNDLIPVNERGRFTGLMASVWALAFAVGPIIGGAIASAGQWRWIFFLNIPICAIAATTVLFFFKVKPPVEPPYFKLARMDWVGVICVICSSAAIILAFTWAGVSYSWSSVQVLAPLIIGCAGMGCFAIIERFWSQEPTIPWSVVGNRTCMSGYIGTFLHGIVSICAVFYLPVYFQAAKGANTIQSSVDMLAFTILIAPFAVFCGATVELANRYRPQNYLGWSLLVVAYGTFTLLDANSSKAVFVGIQIIMGIGHGLIWVAPQFAVLSPLPESNNAYANSFWLFTRYFAQSWGVAIGGAILQNQLSKRLPSEFVSQLPAGTQLAYATIPKLEALPEALRSQVRNAFAGSLQIIWYVMLGISVLGLLSVLLMEEVAMKNTLNDDWGLQDVKSSDVENSVKLPSKPHSNSSE